MAGVWQHRAMAKSRCSCGRVIYWKADEAESDEWFIVAVPGLPDRMTDLGHRRRSAPSPVLWPHWVDGPGQPTVRVRPRGPGGPTSPV